MNLRPKLFLLLGLPFMVSIGLSFFFIINITSGKISTQLHTQLVDQEASLVRQVSEQVNTSAKSYLHAVGEISNKTVGRIFSQYLNGSLTQEEVKSSAFNYLLGQTFMGSGYIYVVDDKGIILSHPNNEKIGSLSTNADWVKSQDTTVDSYINYTYEGREKVLYKIYNKQFDFFLMVSAYVDNFFQTLDLVELNKTMNDFKIGDRGYPLLLDLQGNIVSHVNPKLIGISGLGIEDYEGNKIVQRILKEKEGSFTYLWEEEDGTIEEKFIYYSYEKNSKLIVCSTGYTSDFYFIIKSILRIILLSGGLMALTLIILLYFMATSVAKPVKSFTTNIKDISEGEGDLTCRINVKTKGEIGVMVKSFNKFLSTLQQLIIKIKETSNDTIVIKEEVTSGIDETAAALHEISTNLLEIKNLTNNLNSNVKTSSSASDNILDSANYLDSSVEQQSNMLQTSTAAITEMISSIDNVDNITSAKKESAKKLLESAKTGANDINETQNAVKEVSNQLNNIQEMAVVISDIADRTNLLAMNAAIEAAHAGDAGKGFAVVADEIRKLAESSSSNSSKIRETLEKVSTSIISADKLSERTLHSFNELNTEITGMANALTEISTSTNELQIGGKDILQSITGLEDASNVVRERANSIKSLSSEVKQAMEDTKNVSMEVVTSIDEINQGVTGINDSMKIVTDSTYKLKETSDELKGNVDRFIV